MFVNPILYFSIQGSFLSKLIVPPHPFLQPASWPKSVVEETIIQDPTEFPSLLSTPTPLSSDSASFFHPSDGSLCPEVTVPSLLVVSKPIASRVVVLGDEFPVSLPSNRGESSFELDLLSFGEALVYKCDYHCQSSPLLCLGFKDQGSASRSGQRPSRQRSHMARQVAAAVVAEMTIIADEASSPLLQSPNPNLAMAATPSTVVPSSSSLGCLLLHPSPTPSPAMPFKSTHSRLPSTQTVLPQHLITAPSISYATTGSSAPLTSPSASGGVNLIHPPPFLGLSS
ncbi:hypothetical protein NE237_001693 [Protea cynaroides]|uniref:Uncharacterized protein n=1 Tax=Protea cynaroides TaxID=273540 RepID=A0A9Q0QYL9_9MAGN|nr:hypothetical protein NE237_001693 [Protea cynaroides]